MLGSLMTAVGAIQLYSSLSSLPDFLGSLGSFLGYSDLFIRFLFLFLIVGTVLEASMLVAGVGLVLSRRWARPVAIGVLIGIVVLDRSLGPCIAFNCE